MCRIARSYTVMAECLNQTHPFTTDRESLMRTRLRAFEACTLKERARSQRAILRLGLWARIMRSFAPIAGGGSLLAALTFHPTAAAAAIFWVMLVGSDSTACG